MRATLNALALVALATPAAAEVSPECAELGLTSAYLSTYYCDALKTLADETAPTRSVGDGGETVTLPDGETWGEIGVVRDAYRADPKKTLALIARIRNAGGLGDKD